MTDTLTSEKTPAELNAEWLDKINQASDAKAKELSTLFNCTIEPRVFVIEAGKDAAVAFLKKPDAKLAYKMVVIGRREGPETAYDLLARAQLIRTADVVAKGMTGTGSDDRFMDANGKYADVWTDLNTGYLFEVSTLINPLTDQFKKK